jgi:hypothetical protein
MYGLTKKIVRKSVFAFILMTSNFLISQQYFPGGVTGADVWYIANDNHIVTSVFEDIADNTPLKLDNCTAFLQKSLFNFNPSFYSEALCFTYREKLENGTGKNIFFVSQPKDQTIPNSHISTTWFHNIAAPSIVRNFFDINSSNVNTLKTSEVFQGNKNANVNFYRIRNYIIDRKFKSFGQNGETIFNIGKNISFLTAPTYEDNDFSGNFPEFISFPRELNTNERNRVDSYLALKYGLTLKERYPYLNSKNLVFWDTNNMIFWNNIFGIGKDKISNLNQLQSESTHRIKHLVAAVGDILNTNFEKQQVENIEDNHFIVFGDNKGTETLTNNNSKGIDFWKKTWLAQITGVSASDIKMFFRFYLSTEMIQELTDNPNKKLWMLHDKNVTNNEVSDFDNELILYYQAEDLDLNDGVATFKGVNFDADANGFDQFTFGVGPEMIVQVYAVTCQGTDQRADIKISGGKAPYDIEIVPDLGDTIIDQTNTDIYGFEPLAINYTITVTDANGIIITVPYTHSPWNFNVELGPNQNLNASNQQITLNATLGIGDPDATYEWYKDGDLLDHTSGVFDVTLPGEYTVFIKSFDQSCEVTDSIVIGNDFYADVTYLKTCNETLNTITIEPHGFAQSYFTILENSNGETQNFSHLGIHTITGIAYGNYTVTVTEVLPDESLGQSHETGVSVVPYVGWNEYVIDLDNQFLSGCQNCNLSYEYDPQIPTYNPLAGSSQTIEIDASQNINDPNAVYEWFRDDEPLYIYVPHLIFSFNINYPCSGMPKYTVIVTDPITGCSDLHSFYLRRMCVIEQVLTPEPVITREPETTNTEPETANNQDSFELTTTVYPNPTSQDVTFYYEINYPEAFSGLVEIYAVSGALIQSQNISNASTYVLPYSIATSGVYYIKLTSSMGVVKTDQIIIK